MEVVAGNFDCVKVMGGVADRRIWRYAEFGGLACFMFLCFYDYLKSSAIVWLSFINFSP